MRLALDRWYALDVQQVDRTMRRMLFHAEVRAPTAPSTICGRILNDKGQLRNWSCLDVQCLRLTDEEREKAAKVQL